MGEVINISDYTEKAIEQTIDQLLQETTDVQQLLERLGSLSETQKRKILQLLSNRIQSKKQGSVSEEFSFDDLDSELMRYAHQDRSKKNKDNEKLQKQRRNAMLKRLRKFFSVKSSDENLDVIEMNAEMGMHQGKHASQTPAHPLLNKDNNQFHGKENTEMNANPLQNNDTEEYNDKRPVNAPVHQPTAIPDLTPGFVKTPNPNPF